MLIPDAQSFLEYFDGIRRRTRRAAAAIPPDLLEWRSAPGRWTPGDIVRHIAATERWMFVENALQRPSSYPGHGRELADGPAAVLAYLDAMHEESVQLIGSLTADQLTARCTTPAGTPITVWKWLRAMVEHEVHHRGQLHLLLSMNGIPPVPMFGLTEEEVRERSR